MKKVPNLSARIIPSPAGGRRRSRALADSGLRRPFLQAARPGHAGRHRRLAFPASRAAWIECRMIKILRVLAPLLAGLVFTMSSAYAQAPDTVLLNGKIVAADEKGSIHQAL